jgi:DNA-directed RNA polymerase III subunit RPC6
MGSMEGDEGIIYSFIKDSGTEGIWTKQLKTRSNLHQSVMTRCLKNLEQKQLVKVVKSVKVRRRVPIRHLHR